jgi:predicted O-linked N-acetylglucosamine transferase (SPINDLY family)
LGYYAMNKKMAGSHRPILKKPCCRNPILLMPLSIWPPPSRKMDVIPRPPEMFHKTLQLDPGLPLANYYRARCLQNTGDHTGAISNFQRAIDLEPDNALYWFHLAHSVLKTQSIDQVLVCYQKALRLRPDWDRAHYNLAVAFRLKERLGEAVAHMQRALEINPMFEDAQAYTFRLAQHACDWPLMARAAAQLDALTVRQLQKDIKTAEIPMVSLRRQANPQRNAAVARSWSQHIARETAQLPNRPYFRHSRRTSNRIRIGYLSSDFKDHPVASSNSWNAGCTQQTGIRGVRLCRQL